MALPGSRRQTWDECFSTACIWFLWQAVVQAALGFLGFANTVEQLMGVRVDVCSSCAWFSFDSWCSGIFLLDVSESPGNFAHIPIYGHKDDFPLPLTKIFFLPYSLYSYTGLPFLHELSFGQSLSSSARCKTYLKENRLFCSQKTWDCWWIPL